MPAGKRAYQLFHPPFSSTATINVIGVENLADLRLLFCASQGGGEVTRIDAPLIDDASRFQLGFTVRVDPYDFANRMGLTQVSWIRILAMAAGPDWPDFADFDEETMAVPDVNSNVENCVGYLGGVTSQLVDWPGTPVPRDERCYQLLRLW